jgi:hypothetical protein
MDVHVNDALRQACNLTTWPDIHIYNHWFVFINQQPSKYMYVYPNGEIVIELE